jgi:hypothetical protein
MACEFEMTNTDGCQSQTTTDAPVGRKGKKRGRKAVRPLLRGKKTEDLDKYWIRRFRAYIRKNSDEL